MLTVFERAKQMKTVRNITLYCLLVLCSMFIWGWTGIAESTDGGNTWTKTSGAHDVDSPDGSMTTEFPEWPDTATDEYPEWQSD